MMEALKFRGIKFEAAIRVGKLTDQINQAAAELALGLFGQLDLGVRNQVRQGSHAHWLAPGRTSMVARAM